MISSGFVPSNRLSTCHQKLAYPGCNSTLIFNHGWTPMDTDERFVSLYGDGSIRSMKGCVFAGKKSVFIGVHPWLNKNYAANIHHR
jgi:hypothetical protein